VEWQLAGETEVLRENLSQCCFVHHKLHMPARTRTRAAAVGNQRLTAWATARPCSLLSQCSEFCIILRIYYHIVDCSNDGVMHSGLLGIWTLTIVSEARSVSFLRRKDEVAPLHLGAIDRATPSPWTYDWSYVVPSHIRRNIYLLGL
jgi:hypothetical protein